MEMTCGNDQLKLSVGNLGNVPCGVWLVHCGKLMWEINVGN